ncbi:GerMN domain-containing protein [Tessaracoccus antarcticus]|uniref:GerMN domain-containing protein n=1 Tax=Tessaracoccus antarcticus TaxID=2479848 RepID=UPI001314C091|nr:GerMN domain-containing protein [Tessaracoccus antarcticus]
MIKRLACALLALLLVGCTDIQTTGPVQEVPMGSEPRGVQIAPEPPQPGVTPVRLVEGFVQAMAAPESDWAVARQYLTASAGALWRPRDGGTVYKGVVTEDEGAVMVRGTSTGVLDAAGRFTATGEELSHDFGVILVEGEWRIGLPPDGVLVSDYIFERYWSHMTVYFMAGSGDHVVPDLVHVPDTLLTPSRVVEAQIAGPSPGIAAAVRNAVGPRVRLAPEGASVDAEGTAAVALTGLGRDMPNDRRRLLGAQLLWSLTAIPRVTGLRITSDGEPFQLPEQNSDGVLQLSQQQGFQLLSRASTADLFGVRDGVGGRIGSTQAFLPMNSADERVAEVAVSIDGTLVGFIDETRTSVLVGPLGGALVRAAPTGLTGLRAAQFALGYLWAVGTDAQGVIRLLRVDAQGMITEIDTTPLPGAVVDFSITQAGVRVAAVVERSGLRQIVLASVVGGDKPRLEPALSLPLLVATDTRLTGFRGLDWSGETEFVVIADSGENRTVFRARMDGSLVEDLGPFSEEPVQISALPRPSGDAVVVRSKDDTVWRRDTNTRWSRLDGALQDISYPG